MLYQVSLVASILGFASAQGHIKYGPCDKNVYPYPGTNVSAPIVQVVADKGGVTVSGTVVIIDGCTFGVRDFTLIGAQESYWVGSVKGSEDSLTLSDQYVYPSAGAGSFDFPLKTTAGAAANFEGVNQLRLFSRNVNTIIATVDLPNPVNFEATGQPEQGPSSDNAADSSKNYAASDFKFSGFVILASVSGFYL